MAVALAVRLLALVIRYGMPGSISLRLFPFPSEMAWVARSIVAGWGFASPYELPTGPTALVPPVYPYLLAGIFSLFGVRTMASAIVALSLNCIFSSLTCWCIYRLAKVTFDETVGVVAAWIWALFPLSIFFAIARTWETSLGVLLGTLLVLTAVELERAGGFPRWAALGGVAALAGLTNPALIAPLPLLGIWLILRTKKRGAKWLAPAALSGFVFIALLAPWFIRNYVVFNRFIPLRSGLGQELRLGNGPETEARWRVWLQPMNNPAEHEKLRRLGEAAYMDESKKEALQFIRANPGLFLRQTARRILFMWTGIWSLSPGYLREHPEDLFDILPFTLMTWLALAGLRSAVRGRNQYAWVYAAALFALPVAYYTTHVQPRFRHPMEPFFLILAAYAVIERFRRTREIPRPARA
jgi:4-amino-4-deoxy-L-arabinose transferase-like glycosyltransferase